MSELAVRIEGLSKQYHIGGKQDKYRMLRDSLADAAKAPFRRASQLLKGQAYGASNLTDSIWALKDVSFEIKKGEVVGVIGRNGAGKSTLLKILSRITEPTTGRAEIYGRIGALLEVGTGFHQELTGRENVYLNGAILGMRRTEIERKFDDIVAFAEIEKFIDTPVKHYSSGMGLRLGFAVAAYLEPEILIVDEVLAVGDMGFQQKCMGKMGEIAKNGRTVIFVSHNMGAITSLTQRCFCLSSGELLEQGDTETVIEHYMTRTLQGLPGGYANLETLSRNAHFSAQARFEWVRTLTDTGAESNVFLEGDSIVIEVGIRVNSAVEGLMQLGCGVTTIDGGTSLFTVPSPEFQVSLKPGCYKARLHIDPNYLRPAPYAVAIKLFVDGVRCDTLGQAIQFSVEPRVSGETNPAYFQRWVAGTMRFDYQWDQIEEDEAKTSSVANNQASGNTI